MASLFFGICIMLIWAVPADAYLGPGMGTGIIGVVLGILGSICLGLFAIIYYPIKRALKKLGKKRSKVNDAMSCKQEDD